MTSSCGFYVQLSSLSLFLHLKFFRFQNLNNDGSSSLRSGYGSSESHFKE
jgi:hypothetical protein